MGRFPDRWMDDLRARVTVIEYARKKYKLIKKGSEYILADNESVSISPPKNMWYDFGSGQKGGDAFAFEMFMTGCSFNEAVERIAESVGMRVPDAPKQKTPPASPPPEDDGPPPLDEVPMSAYANGHDHGGGGKAKAKTIHDVIAHYDYVDADGATIYQVCRIEMTHPDGTKTKRFGQRRKGPDNEWAWGLEEDLYIKSKEGEWYRANESRLKWRGAKRVRLEKVAHTLYRMDLLREEMAQDPEERRTIFIPEGEKDVHTLERWGLFATTNSGGAQNWHDYFPDEFSGADVVVLLDNDKAGRDRGNKVAASLRKIAKRVRVLSWPDHWPGCPEKSDVTDWAEQGGTFQKFCEIIDKLPTWSPGRPESNFGALMFRDLDKPGKELSWLVKGVLTEGEVSIWYGQWGSGKSFLITDCAMTIARSAGNRWMGSIVKPGLVIYQAGEGALGLRQRLRAYRQHHHLPEDDDVPFVLLTSRIDIFSSEADTDRLIVEIKAWASYYNEILRLVVIDTLNAATPGADENSGRDIGPVINRARKIAQQTGAHVALVDHTPKDGGTPRGWSGKLGNVDNAIEVARTGRSVRQETKDKKRTIEREVRSWKVVKQKDEADKKMSEFVLERVVLGNDTEGDEISSCVISPLSSAASAAAANRNEVPKGWSKVNSANEDLFRSLVKALKKSNRTAPEGIEAPAGEPVATIAEWQAEVLELYIGHEEVTPVLRDRLKKRVQRACKHWTSDAPNAPRLIFKQREYVWRTGRKVFNIDELPHVRTEAEESPAPLLAKGESVIDLANDLDGGLWR